MKFSQITITLAACQLLTGTCFGLTPLSENFNATALNTTRWTLKNYGKGRLTQSGGKMNFTISTSLLFDGFPTLELKNNRPGYNESWEVILDVVNTSGQGENVGIGLLIFNAADYNDQVNLEFNGKGVRGGFVAIGITNDQDDPQADIRVNPNVTQGSLRITFNKSSKLFTFWYDSTGPADGVVWAKLSTFSTSGIGGDRRGNWNMNLAGGRFGIQLYGFADNRSFAAGNVSFDNFKLKGLP